MASKKPVKGGVVRVSKLEGEYRRVFAQAQTRPMQGDNSSLAQPSPLATVQMVVAYGTCESPIVTPLFASAIPPT